MPGSLVGNYKFSQGLTLLRSDEAYPQQALPPSLHSHTWCAPKLPPEGPLFAYKHPHLRAAARASLPLSPSSKRAASAALPGLSPGTGAERCRSRLRAAMMKRATARGSSTGGGGRGGAGEGLWDNGGVDSVCGDGEEGERREAKGETGCCCMVSPGPEDRPSSTVAVPVLLAHISSVTSMLLRPTQVT